MTSVSDVRPATTERTIGAIARDYLVLIKPSIIVLLLITTIPAMVLATDDWPDGWLVTATLIGGIFAAGGAGAVNMYIDREIDNVMVRTRSRPIPSGRVPARHAAIGLVDELVDDNGGLGAKRRPGIVNKAPRWRCFRRPAGPAPDR